MSNNTNLPQQCILVPTDFSDYAAEAMTRAVRLAELLNARIHVIYIMETFIMNYANDVDGLPLPMSTEIEHSFIDMAKSRLATWLESWQQQNISSEVFQEGGTLARIICRTAKNIDAQLIVMGKHGHQSALEHLLIGSTTERVVRHASCSVLVAMPYGILGE